MCVLTQNLLTPTGPFLYLTLGSWYQVEKLPTMQMASESVTLLPGIKQRRGPSDLGQHTKVTMSVLFWRCIYFADVFKDFIHTFWHFWPHKSQKRKPILMFVLDLQANALTHTFGSSQETDRWMYLVRTWAPSAATLGFGARPGSDIALISTLRPVAKTTLSWYEFTDLERNWSVDSKHTHTHTNTHRIGSGMPDRWKHSREHGESGN